MTIPLHSKQIIFNLNLKRQSKMKLSFILHKDSLCVLEDLTNEQRGELFYAIYCYQIGKEIELKPIVKIAFSQFKNQFVRDEEKSNSGKYHWNWKNGITSENKMLRNSPRYKEWRRNVFTRDNYTCMHCSRKGVGLNAHHIKHWATHRELRFSIDNGITLCKRCHKTEHRNER